MNESLEQHLISSQEKMFHKQQSSSDPNSAGGKWIYGALREQSDPGLFPKARVIKQSCNFPQFHKHSTLTGSAFLVIG